MVEHPFDPSEFFDFTYLPVARVIPLRIEEIDIRCSSKHFRDDFPLKTLGSQERDENLEANHGRKLAVERTGDVEESRGHTTRLKDRQCGRVLISQSVIKRERRMLLR